MLQRSIELTAYKSKLLYSQRYHKVEISDNGDFSNIYKYKINNHNVQGGAKVGLQLFVWKITQ